MGHMQPSYGPRTDNECPTSGGDTTLVNGDERLVIPMHEKMTCTYSPLGEDDSHVQSVYREHSAGQQM